MYLIDTCISPPDNPKVGGAERQLYLLATSLSNIFMPIVVQLSPYKPLPIDEGHIGRVEVVHFPTGRLYSLSGLRQLGRLFLFARIKKVDIIHTWFEKSEVIGWFIKRLSGIPFWMTSRRDLGFKRKEIYKKLFMFSIRDCNKCIANCYAINNLMVQEEKIAEGKVTVIYNGLDLSLYQKVENKGDLRKDLGLNDGVPLIGMIANFYLEIKGHQYFLEAAKNILGKIQNVEFLIIGEGTLRQFYEKMAFKLNIKNKVHFLGRRGDIPWLLSNLSISVISSISEGFSNVILESMAAGKPVVATNVGGSKEMIKDGITGYLVPAADSSAMASAIINLLQNPEKAMAMGAAGQKIVQEKFTLEAMVKSYEKLYFSLLEDRG